MLYNRPIKMTVAALLVLGVSAWLIMSMGQDESKDVAESEKKEISTAAEGGEAPYARPIPTAVAQLVREGHSRVFPGKVRANQRAELSFPVGGKLVELDAREGSRVKRGQILARLDQRDFRQELDAAVARFRQAERNLTKFRSLHEQRVVTKTQFDDVQTAYDIALADLKIQEKALADTTLRAPFDGVVVNRCIENFGYIKKDETVLLLQDISDIEVVIQVPERLIARKGTDGLSRLQVRFDADPEKERRFEARMREYSVESDKITRTYDVVVGLAPPENFKVLPGMTASVSALVGKFRESRKTHPVTQVPVEAVWKGVDGESYVWVITPEGGYPEKRQVRIASLRGDFAEIESGLEAGAHVAIAGVHSLRENALARPQTAREGGLDG